MNFYFAALGKQTDVLAQQIKVYDHFPKFAVSRGEQTNVYGLDCRIAKQSSKDVLIRLNDLAYQTAGRDSNGDRKWPFAFIVIPKTERPIVIQDNVQQYKGEPAEWKEIVRLGKK